MKHLFVEGNFKDKELIMEPINVNFDNINLRHSSFIMSALIGLYDFDKIEGTDYYYIYQKYGMEDKKDSKVVSESLKEALKGNKNNIANWNHLSINDEESKRSDIFWDVNNNIILIKGEENLKKMCIELLMNGFFDERTEESEKRHIEAAIDVPLIVKTQNLKVEYTHNNYYPRPLI